MPRRSGDPDGSRPAWRDGVRLPVRATLVALAVGVGWAALHVPMDPPGDDNIAQLVAWVMHALVAAVLTLCAFEVGGALALWLYRNRAMLLSHRGN